MPMYQRARNGIAILPRNIGVPEADGATISWQSRNAAHLRLRATGRRDSSLPNWYRPSRGQHGLHALRRRAQARRDRPRLTMSPKFILLDEPFAGIDPLAVQDIQASFPCLKNKGIGILITTTTCGNAGIYVPRLSFINDGKIIEAGTPADIHGEPRVREFYLRRILKL